jgi:hypothetical protein
MRARGARSPLTRGARFLDSLRSLGMTEAQDFLLTPIPHRTYC